MERWPAPVNAPAVVRVTTQPPPVERAVWHYSVNGARRGPVTSAQLKSLVESSVLRPNDLLWREGLPAWVEAGTVPELFPALQAPPAAPFPAPLPVPVPVPPPRPQATEPNYDDDRRSRRDDRQAIQVHVNQTIERDDDYDDRRPRRRRGPSCPYCGSRARPIYRQQVSQAGWVVFALLLVFTIIFCFIGLFMTEEVRICPDCGARI